MQQFDLFLLLRLRLFCLELVQHELWQQDEPLEFCDVLDISQPVAIIKHTALKANKSLYLILDIKITPRNQLFSNNTTGN